MKNMRKRMLSLMVALMMCLSLVQPTAFAATTGEETEAAGTGDINIQTVVVEKNTSETPDTTPSTPPSNTDIPQAPSEATPPSGEGTTESQEPSGGEGTGDSSESEKPELVNPDGSINPDAVERPEQSDSVTTTPGSPVTPAEDEKEPTPPEEQDPTPPVENEKDPAGEQETTDPKEPADSEESGKPTEPEAPINWKVFWNDETKSYELTYEIAEDAQGDQTVDLTKALELLNKYAQDIEKVEKPVEPLAGVSEEDMAAYQKDKEEFDNFYKKVVEPFVGNFAADWNYVKNHTVEEVLAEFNYWQGSDYKVPEKPQATVDKNSPEYQTYLKALEAYNRQENANLLQPGDIRKFTIYLTSQSGHTYKYKDGSFILATPGFGENAGTVTGFDGQKIPEQYTKAEQTYNISGGLAPILNLFAEKTGQSLDTGSFRGLVYDSDSLESLLETVGNKYGTEVLNNITQELGITYTNTDKNYSFTNVRQGLSDYLVKYYSEKDGKSYKDLDDVFAHSSTAASDMSSTDNQGTASKEKWTIEGERILATYGKDFQYNNFYQSLISFIYGNVEDVDKLLGASTGTNSSFHPEYGPESWSSHLDELGLDYSVALEQYMAHKEAWDTANEYFKELLAKGLSVKAATSYAFAMAVNIDGKLTSNSWQNTQWGWYNSIQLEQMDIDFSLTKKDGETGETITNSETGFQVYYIDKVTAEDGSVTSVNMYCSYDEDTQSYTFTTTPGTVWTQNGELKIDYAMMKDIVYYLQETVAPEGYEKDPNVYIVMNEDDYSKLSEEAKADLEGTFDKFLDLNVSNGGLSVSTDFVNIKIVTTPDRPTPPPTPDPDPDPDPEEPPVDVPDPDVPMVPPPEEPPEEPPVDIPEEDPPLVDIPEEEPPLVDVPDPDVPLAPRPSTPTKPVAPKPPVTTVEVEIPDEDVPLADVPNTGDGTGLWCVLGLMAGAGLAYLFLEEKKRQNNAQ